jgi:hypothetical protein
MLSIAKNCLKICKVYESPHLILYEAADFNIIAAA